jgi:hypothetical protein
VARHKVSIDDRPSSNRRSHEYTAPLCGNRGGPLPVSCPRKCAGDRFRMVRRDESRNSDPPAPRHSSLPTLKGARPSRCEAASQPVALRGPPMEVREPPRAVREQPVDLWKERARLRGELVRYQEQPMGLRTAATGPRPEETGSARSVAPSLPWIAARCAHGGKNPPTISPDPSRGGRRQRHRNSPKLAGRGKQSLAGRRAAKGRGM